MAILRIIFIIAKSQDVCLQRYYEKPVTFPEKFPKILGIVTFQKSVRLLYLHQKLTCFCFPYSISFETFLSQILHAFWTCLMESNLMILKVHGKTTYAWHTDDIRVHTDDIRVIHEYIRVTYDYIRVHMSDIRVYTSGIRMTCRYVRATYRLHTSTYEWLTDDKQVTYGWHTSTYEWHTDDQEY